MISNRPRVSPYRVDRRNRTRSAHRLVESCFDRVGVHPVHHISRYLTLSECASFARVQRATHASLASFRDFQRLGDAISPSLNTFGMECQRLCELSSVESIVVRDTHVLLNPFWSQCSGVRSLHLLTGWIGMGDEADGDAPSCDWPVARYIRHLGLTYPRHGHLKDCPDLKPVIFSIYGDPTDDGQGCDEVNTSEVTDVVIRMAGSNRFNVSFNPSLLGYGCKPLRKLCIPNMINAHASLSHPRIGKFLRVLQVSLESKFLKELAPLTNLTHLDLTVIPSPDSFSDVSIELDALARMCELHTLKITNCTDRAIYLFSAEYFARKRDHLRHLELRGEFVRTRAIASYKKLRVLKILGRPYSNVLWFADILALLEELHIEVPLISSIPPTYLCDNLRRMAVFMHGDFPEHVDTRCFRTFHHRCNLTINKVEPRFR
jgi:hypothetical protein